MPLHQMDHEQEEYSADDVLRFQEDIIEQLEVIDAKLTIMYDKWDKLTDRLNELTNARMMEFRRRDARKMTWLLTFADSIKIFLGYIKSALK